MKKILALYDSDVHYVTKLMEYLKNMKWEDFDILLFTRQESLADFIKYQPVEILLIGSDSLPDEMLNKNIKYIIHLSENQNDSQRQHRQIYKYRSAGEIASDIISCYTKLEDINESRYFEDILFISVFSPVAGAEKISFAWSFAKELSFRRKTLFIPMDLFPVNITAKVEQSSYAMSEYLYYLKENRPDIISQLKTYLNYSEKLSYLSGVSHGFDLLSLSKEETERFIKKLKEHKDYEAVIFYLGLYTEASMEILRQSDKAYLAYCNLPYEELVIKEWTRQIDLMGIAEEINCQKIILPAGGTLAGQNKDPEYIFNAVRPYGKEAAEQIYK